MTESAFSSSHNPDVLTCLANLSSDEVFTPPQLANDILDMLPAEIWRDHTATFLDPCAKSGVFLREIAKRLIKGLENDIPDLQERINHILTKQVFGIAITELTALLSRRSLYCSKKADGKYSIISENAPTISEGNIIFPATAHTWHNGRCAFCGASQSGYQREDGLESHAYTFIHTKNPQELFNMHFDVIIGNPPYQLGDGGNQASAIPLYHKFIQQAKKLNPRYLTMIVPSRWFSGGRGLGEFREEMLADKRIRKLVDYFDSNECFPGVDISGGICYFLWEKENEGECVIDSIRGGEASTMQRSLLEPDGNSFIRFNEAVTIVRKVATLSAKKFSELVSSQKPFGLRTYVQGAPTSDKDSVRLYANRNVSKEPGYISRTAVPENEEWIDKWKIYISAAYGERGSLPYLVLGKPFLGEPGSCCTETFQVIGTFKTKKQAENAMTYIATRFFRFLVLLIKNTQHAPKRVYSFVPMEDFSEPWTDKKLYAKYGITNDEIAFIESMIRPMNLIGDEENESSEQ